MFAIAKTPSLSARIDQNEKNPAFDQELDKKSDKELEEIVRFRSETL